MQNPLPSRCPTSCVTCLTLDCPAARYVDLRSKREQRIAEEGNKKCLKDNLKLFHMLLYHIPVHMPVSRGACLMTGREAEGEWEGKVWLQGKGSGDDRRRRRPPGGGPSPLLRTAC